MEQDEREVPNLPEGKEEQGDGAPVPGGVAVAEGGLARGAASSEQEGISGTGDDGCRAAVGSESDEEEDAEAIFASDASTEELERVAPVGNDARGDTPGNGRNEDPATIYFASRVSTGQTSVSHGQAGDAASGIANADDAGTSEAASVPLPTASIGSPSATSRSAGVSALANAGHGAKNEATVSSTATRRSEIDVAVDKPCSDDHNTESKDMEAAPTSSSCRYPSRGRKQRRPDGCISDPEEHAGAAAAAVPRLVGRPEWARNVTADDIGVQEQSGSNVSRTASGGGGPEGPPDGGTRILAIVAILGASLALSLVSCVLFYIVGQRTASGLPDTDQKK